MEKIYDILLEIEPDIDVNCQTLVSDHYLDSLAIISLIAELEEAFDIMIPAVEITENNLNSAESIFMLVNRLIEDEMEG